MGISKVLYIVGGLVGIALIVLFASGAFDSAGTPSASAALNQNNQTNPHSGADMAALQKITALQNEVDSNPGNNEKLLQLAHLLNDNGFHKRAINRYKQYLDANPNSADVWVDMGVCYYETNQYEQALESMKKGLEVEPKHQIGHFNIGIVNMAMGNREEAEQWWQKAIEINPSTNIANKAKELINLH